MSERTWPPYCGAESLECLRWSQIPAQICVLEEHPAGSPHMDDMGFKFFLIRRPRRVE